MIEGAFTSVIAPSHDAHVRRGRAARCLGPPRLINATALTTTALTTTALTTTALTTTALTTTALTTTALTMRRVVGS